ncbi:MAG TPA: LysR substrate-binding domain-containing protein [Burkholderiales bacterium]|nr:LysR substrate-binding domain-containing protein [Burkholderiales bacterium]
MTLQQLRALCEIVRQGLRLSQAAVTLNTSQPGVSKQIKLLEKELGVVIFRRRRNRILALTDAGKEIVRFAEGALREVQNIRGLGADARDSTAGTLVIATTHTHARYTLPRVIGAFTSAFPQVRLEFRQGNRDEIFRWVESGEADVAIGTDASVELPGVALVPYGEFHRIVVTRPAHALLTVRKLTLEGIAQYPLIAYGFRSNERWKLRRAFEARGLEPNIVFSAADADVSKSYVELGIGIAILPHVTYDAERDPNLRARDASHLFEPEITHIGLNRERFIRNYVYAFLGILSPALTRERIQQALRPAARA